jgi:hypothetical protein
LEPDPFFSTFNNDISGICGHRLSSIRRSSEKQLIVCDGLGEHVGLTEEQVLNGSKGGQNSVFVDGHVLLVRGTYQQILESYQVPNSH